MQSKVSGALKALTMLRNVPLYHLPSYQIHGSWKSNRPPFSVCPRVLLYHILPKAVKKNQTSQTQKSGVLFSTPLFHFFYFRESINQKRTLTNV